MANPLLSSNAPNPHLRLQGGLNQRGVGKQQALLDARGLRLPLVPTVPEERGQEMRWGSGAGVSPQKGARPPGLAAAVQVRNLDVTSGIVSLPQSCKV